MRRTGRAGPGNRRGPEKVGVGYFRGRRHRFPQLMVVFVEIVQGGVRQNRLTVHIGAQTLSAP